jgi:LEA14-like dessication related protein
MTARASAALFMLITLAALPACSSYQDPGFRVIAVRETDRTPEAAVLTFTISANNRNDVALPMRTADYRLELEGTQVFRGTRSARATVRRFGSQTFELPAVIPADTFDLSRLDAGEDLPYRLTGAVEYQTPGELAEVLFDAGVRRPKAELNLRGRLRVE